MAKQLVSMCVVSNCLSWLLKCVAVGRLTIYKNGAELNISTYEKESGTEMENIIGASL